MYAAKRIAQQSYRVRSIDLSPSSQHTRRRIWQEAITTLFLTSEHCRIPATQPMVFAHAPDSEYPPYLLGFTGTPAERHVENLKVRAPATCASGHRLTHAQILREVGPESYARAIALTTGPDAAWFMPVAREIQRHFVGPDSYWRDPAREGVPGCTGHFGHAWWIPFPPTVVSPVLCAL
jgi:hypothetical protein